MKKKINNMLPKHLENRIYKDEIDEFNAARQAEDADQQVQQFINSYIFKCLSKFSTKMYCKC